MIRYIIGRAGTGKSRRAIDEIGMYLKEGGEQRLFLLVPEQFTLQAERDLIEQLQLPGIMRVEVLSFNRLAYRVLAEAGGRTRVLINEQGKNMVLKKIIDENAKQLKIYQKAAKQSGFVEHISELLAAFKQYDLDADRLRSQQAEMQEGIARQKLQDILLIYEAFNAYMAGHYLDMEDQFNLFIEKIDHSVLLQDTRIWLDGFEHFTPQHRRILEKIMRQAQDTTFCLSMDAQPGRDSDLFKLSAHCYQQIHELAARHGLQEEMIKLPGNQRLDPLGHLERQLFAYPGRAYTNQVDGIEVFAASNIYSEVEQAAARMVALVREQGYRWRDMAVITGDLDTYGSVMRRVFYEYEIPYFLDEKREISNHPLIKLILSSLALINRGYRHNDLLLLLKTGFTDLNQTEAERLENYLLTYGLQGKLVKEEFRRGQAELGEEKLQLLDSYRQRFLHPVLELEQKVVGRKNGREISRAVYEYLQKLDLENKLQLWTEQLKSDGHYEYVHENAQIWNIVMETFDQVVEILGDIELNLKEYARILETGYQSFSVGIIPTTVDQVQVGNIERTKTSALKALLVLGVNDGILPAGRQSEGLFTAEDKDLLKNHGLEWGADGEIQAQQERLAIYMAFSKPSELLHISYALSDHEGKAMRPSLLISRIHGLFPALQGQSNLIKSQVLHREQIVTARSSFKYLVENLRGHLDGEAMDDFWWDVYHWYYEAENWRESREAMLEALFYTNQTALISPQNAINLYKIPFRSSVSRLEQFAACPFAHFVRFGLQPQERKTFAVGAPDVGILLHDCLASFASTVKEHSLNWKALNRDDCDAIMGEIMETKIPLHNNGVLVSSYRYRYLAQRLQRISRRAIWTLTEHIQQGEFEPFLHEARFGPGGVFPALRVELSDGSSIFLEGRIDRIDLLETEDSTYVKIIDYKSGNQKLRLSDIYFGLSLQLFVYLAAVLNEENEAHIKPWKPAALFYFKIDDPLISSEERLTEAIEAKIRQELKLKGLVLKDIAIARSMDANLGQNSDILPVGIKQDQAFTARSSVLDEQDFAVFIHYTENLLRELGEEMMRGKILIEPVQRDQRKACDNCIYHAICQFDKLFADNHYKNIPALQDEEVLVRLRAEGGIAHEQLD